VGGWGRYFRLFGAFGRFSLANEMAFRGNFAMKVLVEVLWLGILLIFYDTLFQHTHSVANSWDRWEYLFFLGCYYALEGLIETLFLENATDFAELVRTGGLDFYLLKPIDEQFLVSFRKIDWSTAPKIALGAAIVVFALVGRGRPVEPWTVAAFLALSGCGAAMAYSFLLMLSATSVWIVRNQSLMEMWWMFTTLMRYPRAIFLKQPLVLDWAFCVYVVFWYAVPVLLITSVPAETMVKTLPPCCSLSAGGTSTARCAPTARRAVDQKHLPLVDQDRRAYIHHNRRRSTRGADATPLAALNAAPITGDFYVSSLRTLGGLRRRPGVCGRRRPRRRQGKGQRQRRQKRPRRAN
jgi:ABC-2 type transport system permease protein